MSKKSKAELTDLQKALAETFLQPFDTPQQMRDWIYNFFDIDFPMGTVDPDSNSSPIDWMFEAYNVMRFNKGEEVPQIVVYSAREVYKTLSCSAFEVIAMVHFKSTVAHMAAIKTQSAKAIQYINSFLRKIEPYLEFHGMEITSQNTSNISITDSEGNKPYTTVIVCTMTGANSEHTNLMVVDEIDVVANPQAFEEAKAIPGMLNGRFPLTIFTSTRKFAFGLMQKEIEKAQENKFPVRHWNILDVTESCEPERHMPDLPMVERYIAKRLPLNQISPEEYLSLPDEKKAEFQSITAFAGCAKCPLLPVCKTTLATRPKTDKGALWKPIGFTINQFKKLEPDMAEAQLMCWKPSTTGLVYPRFDKEENCLSIKEAYYQFTGEDSDDVTLNDLILALLDAGVNFYVGGDWGFRHNFALVVGAVLPSGDFWIIECFAMSGLEFPDMMKYSEYIRDKYRPKKWFMDTAQPMFIKSFRKAGMMCKDFKKDVSGGIAAIRGQIIDASNRRRLKVIDTDENKILIKMFSNHHFKTDAAGNITPEPDDEEYADIADSLRYMGQNLFAPKGRLSAGDLQQKELDIIEKRSSVPQFQPNPGQRNYFQEIFDMTVDKDSKPGKGKSSSGSIFWDFSDT